MICQPCGLIVGHSMDVCLSPSTCPCQHGTMIEQDPNDPSVPAYVDALSEAERRAAYQARGRTAPDLGMAHSGYVPDPHLSMLDLLADDVVVAQASLVEFERTLPDFPSMPMKQSEKEFLEEGNQGSKLPFPRPADGRRALGKKLSEKARLKLWGYAPKRRSRSKP